jgi:hypothetical protein
MKSPLTRLLTASGLSMAQLGRLVLAGRDPRLVRRWFAGADVPDGTLAWAQSVDTLDVETRADGSATVTITYAPGTVVPPGRPRRDAA